MQAAAARKMENTARGSARKPQTAGYPQACRKARPASTSGVNSWLAFRNQIFKRSIFFYIH